MALTSAREVFIACLLFAIAIGAGPEDNVNIDSQLPGSYEYINVLELFNFPFDTSLNFICPKRVEVSAAQASGSFGLKLTNGSDSDSGFECYVQNNEVVRATLQRVEPIETSNETSQTSGPATSQDLDSYYPTFFGNFSDHPFICSFLNASVQPTTVTVRDTAYLYTVLNQYKSLQIPLGQNLDVLNWNFFEKIRGTYTIGLTIVPDRFGCTFIEKSDKDALLAMKNEILNPSPSPTERPTASISSTPMVAPSVSIPANSSPASSPTAPETKAACFPANAKVKLSTGEFISMRDLQVGSLILDSSNSFSKVILFTHADSEILSEFVHIHAEGTDIVLSPGHFLYVNNRSVAAEDIQAGDVVTKIMDSKKNPSKPSTVKLVEKKILQGLYNPHTTSGRIVIFWNNYDGVLASTYTKAVNPRLAHTLLWPLRQLAERTGKTFGIFSKPFNKGNKFWPLLFKRLHNSFKTCLSIITHEHFEVYM